MHAIITPKHHTCFMKLEKETQKTKTDANWRVTKTRNIKTSVPGKLRKSLETLQNMLLTESVSTGI